MTPHHLFKNRDLRELFGSELCRVLYMQTVRWPLPSSLMWPPAKFCLKTARLMQKNLEIKKKPYGSKKSLTDALKSILIFLEHGSSGMRKN
ncbi:MAG: hypothetical protein R2861_16680 [Desulfobacterales bacterium]